MRAVCVFMLLCSLLPPSAAEGSEAADRREEEGAMGRGRRSVPYWGLWSSDFIGWLEELRGQADEAGMQDLARTYWAHFPIANQLGYDSPESDRHLKE